MNCGKPSANTTKIDAGALSEAKSDQTGDISRKSVSKVPEWNTFYPSRSVHDRVTSQFVVMYSGLDKN
jgi:hypothetical protein